MCVDRVYFVLYTVNSYFLIIFDKLFFVKMLKHCGKRTLIPIFN